MQNCQHIILLTYYSTYGLWENNNKMVGLFISEWDGRCDWLLTTAEHNVVWSIWAGDHGELSCTHFNREWQFHAKSHGPIGAFLACPPDWAQSPPLLRDERGLPLPGYETIIPVLWILFSRLSMLPSYQLLSANSFNNLCASYCFVIRIACSCEISMISFNFYWYLSLDSFPR